MTQRVTFKNGPNDDDGARKNFDLQLNLFDLARSLIKARKFIIVTTLTVVFLYAGYLFLQPNQFSSWATILPSGKSGGGMSALKSLVGFASPMMAADENSSILFPVILRSNTIVDAVLKQTYSSSNGDNQEPVILSEYYDQANRDKLRRALRESTRIQSDNQTGEIDIAVETDYPWLSQAVLTEYLTQLEDFNLNKRQSAARNNKVYLEKQLEQNKIELCKAEDNLEAYQKANLDWAGSGSPEIQKETGRLQREVQTRSSSHLMLTQQFEVAKFDARKDVPIIRILDEPSLPVMKSGPFRRNMIIFAFFLTASISCFLVIVRDLISGNLTGTHKRELDLLGEEISITFPRSSRIIQKVTNLTL